MNSDIASVLSAVNAPGVRQLLDENQGLDALAIGKFHAAFANATKLMIVESDFRQRFNEALSSGSYLQSGLINHFVAHARYSLDCQSEHQLLPDRHCYQIFDRPAIDGRTWYTRTERKDAAILCAERPLLPLAHMMLLSMATDQIFDKYFSDRSQAAMGDFTSFVIRWNPDNTTGEIVPAVALMYFRSRGYPGSGESIAEMAGSARDSEIEKAIHTAKNFIVKGGFFSLPLHDAQGAPVKVTCPGMTFMKTYWDLQADLYSALVRDSDLAQVRSWSDAIRRVFQEALA